MTFGEFNKLACGDRVTLISAIDTLMQAGQTYIRGTEIAEIISELKKGGGNLFTEQMDYDMPLVLADGNHIDWTCQDCGATGKEGFQRVFTTHYDVCDGDGKPFPISND